MSTTSSSAAEGEYGSDTSQGEAATPIEEGPSTSPERAATARPAAPARRRRRKTQALVVSALAAGVVGAVLVVSLTQADHHLKQDNPVPAAATDGAFTVGSATAPIVVDVYADYGCAGCAAPLQTVLGPLAMSPLTGKSRVRYHLAGTAATPSAITVANAVACASDESTDNAADYWAMLVPYPEGDIDDAKALEAASRLSLDTPAFTACVHNGTYKAWLAAAGSKNLPAQPQPRFTINGKAVSATELAAQLHVTR